MCITFFYIPNANSNEKFIMSFNRDESMAKKTSTLGYFEEDTNITGGRDLEGRGTWCGINKKTGVVAFLTNYDTEKFHDISDIKYGRGNLTHRFLKTEFGVGEIDKKIQDELIDILAELDKYNAFNLVVGNITTNNFYYICNPYNSKQKVTLKPELLKQGQFYALTNTDIHTSWPKSQHGLQSFTQIIQNYKGSQLATDSEKESKNGIQMNDVQLIQELQKLMFDRTIFNEDPESESSILVQQYFSKYCKKQRGTVSSCYIVLNAQIQGIYEELYLVNQEFNQILSEPIKTTLYL